MQQAHAQPQSDKVANFWRPAALGAGVLFLANVYQPAMDLYKTLFNPNWAEVESVAPMSVRGRFRVRGDPWLLLVRAAPDS